MTDNIYNIFIKKQTKQPNIIITEEDINDMIPTNAQSSPSPSLEQTHTEYRWRIFKFPNRQNEIIEISRRQPNTPRLFMNRKGQWVEYNTDEFDQYTTKALYYYM